MSQKSKGYIDFSIIIPTFNRCNFLKLAIASALQQKRITFEVIVSDNCSSDDTEKIVKGFKDSRIRYTKNKKNIGLPLNIQKCFREACGSYIFTLSDDDFILDENTLFNVLKVMRKYRLGMAKIGTISYEKSPISPYQVFILSEKLVVFKPERHDNILLKSENFGLGFFSGLIFDNLLINKNKLTDNAAWVYLSLAYDVITRYGIAYIPKQFIIAHLSTEYIGWYFDIEKYGSFYIEDYFAFVEEFIDDKGYEEYKRQFLQRNVKMLPNYKYFSNNKNYIRILKRLISIDRTQLINPKFITYAISGFLPKFIIKIIRDLMIYYSDEGIRRIVAKYQYFQKIEKLGISKNINI